MEQLYKRFRFEMLEGDYDKPGHRTCEVACHFPDLVSWVEVMNHFAHFLEGCGYVGVTQKLDAMIAMYETEEKKEFDYMCGGTD